MPNTFDQNFQEQQTNLLNQQENFQNQQRWGWPSCPPCPPCRCDCRQCWGWGNNWGNNWNRPWDGRSDGRGFDGRGQGNQPRR